MSNQASTGSKDRELVVGRRRQRKQGMTLVELMMAVALTIIVVGGLMAAYIQGLLIAQQEQIYNELQLNLELAMEHLRTDLRLSSVGISMMSFYPTNSSEFTAISLPRSMGTNGLVQVDTNGNVVWNQTVVYHVQPGSPDRLMRTVFQPRYTNAASELYQQLSKVVVATTVADFQAACLPFGSPTESFSTNVVFANLVNIEFISGETNMTYDCYAPEKSKGSHTFGSIVLGPGNHTVELTAVDKNPASSGYNFAIDKISLSPSRSPREGELFDLINTHPAAPYYVHAVGGGGSSSAHFEDADTDHPIIFNLAYESGVQNGRLSMNIYNDLWCDTEFITVDGVGSNCNVKLDYEFTNNAPNVPDIVVSPSKGAAWSAGQCGLAGAEVYAFTNLFSVTNVIYGINTNNDLTIERDGYWARLRFERADSRLSITNVQLIDVASGVISNVTFGGVNAFTIAADSTESSTNSDWIPMWPIYRTGTYRVRFDIVPNPSDEDLDILLGRNEGNGVNPFYGDIIRLENTGSAGTPVFGAVIENPVLALALNKWATKPKLADIDADGDLDCFIGTSDGTITFYRNDGGPVNPAWVLVTNKLAGIDCGLNTYCTPAFADINGDGDLDLFVGAREAGLRYCENTGSPSAPTWSTNVVMPWQGITAAMPPMPLTGVNLMPEFVDINDDGDMDLFIGLFKLGRVAYYENTGSVAVAAMSPVSVGWNTYIATATTPYAPYPAFADIDADGDFDMFLGERDGKIKYYQNDGTAANAVWAAPDSFWQGIQIFNKDTGAEVNNYATPTFGNLDHTINSVTCWSNEAGVVLSYTNGVASSNLLCLSSIEVGYAKESSYRSGVFDTRKAAPAYNQMNATWVENDFPAGDVDIRIRSSDSPDMAGASWSGYFQGNTGNSLTLLPKKRYVQYEALFSVNAAGTKPYAHTNDRPDAILRDITIDWPGDTALVDLLVDFDLNTDCGMITATVDGETLVESVAAKMEIYRVGRTGTNTVRGVLQVRPLNTRK